MLRLRIFMAAIGALALAGCVSTILARKIVAPPNKSGIQPMFSNLMILKHAPDAFADVWTLAIAQPPAHISVASIEPGDYSFAYDLRIEYVDGKQPNISHFAAFWRSAEDVVRYPGAPKGTVLLLHGYLQDRNSVTPWAIRLAQAGFRCAVVDMRGHGASTGDHISFGAFEARDISAVIDDLDRRGWDVSRIGLFGVSYGASVALLTAGRDTRVKTVVAVEPFASAERAVPELMRGAFAQQAAGITNRQFAAAHLKQARIAGFNWHDADIPAALSHTMAPVLFVHGEADTWLSPDHSRVLFEHAPAGSKLVLVPHDNHVSLPLQIAPLEADVIGWIEAGLKPN
jgi:pimeloyl-ACP methyl ester carboxylesterase